MLRTAWLLPLKGFSTLGLRPACYRASWQLPGRDSHPQATTSLQWITIYILDLHLLGERYSQDTPVTANIPRARDEPVWSPR
jgi:hypothetical protein